VTLKAYSPDHEVSSHPAIYTSYIARNMVLARWGYERGDLPGNSEIGVALEFPGGGLEVGCSFYFAERGRREVRSGVRTRLSEDFEVRVGYRRRTGLISDHANDLPWERGLLAGFGLAFGPVRLDYTFEDASPLDNIHRFAVTTVPSRDKRN
jgi:hypothetical protein